MPKHKFNYKSYYIFKKKNKNNIYLYVKACIINIYKLKSLGEFVFSSFVYCYYY